MIVRLQVLEDDHDPEDGRMRDEVILAINKVMDEAVWESDGENTWLVKQSI